MTYDSKIIESSGSLSEAWVKSFLAVKRGRHYPLITVINDIPENLNDIEDKAIQKSLNQILESNNCSSTNTVANTIFPWSLWNQNQDRDSLFERYLGIELALKTVSQNRRGTYFERMINYTDTQGNSTNQINKIINLWNSGTHRHSGLQIGIFDANKDHLNGPYLGFPCLHQISIDPYGANGKDGIGLTAFYATQLMVKKAYGNYLGLCRLGKFIAHELGLKFARLTCIAAKPGIDSTLKSKTELKAFSEQLTNKYEI